MKKTVFILMILISSFCGITTAKESVSSNAKSYEERCLRPTDFFNSNKGFWMISDSSLESLVKKRGYSKVAEGPYRDPYNGSYDYATTIKTYQLKSTSGKWNKICIHFSDYEEGHDIIFSDQNQLNSFIQKAEKMGFKKSVSGNQAIWYDKRTGGMISWERAKPLQIRVYQANR